MSSNRYLEFDSTYRDRNQGPTSDGLASGPANFVVEISQSGQNSNATALDPVSNAAPLTSWNSSFDELNADTTIALDSTPIVIGGNSLSDRTTLLITAAAGTEFRDIHNYYVGSIITLTFSGANYYRRIISYQRIEPTQAKIVVDSAVPDGIPFAGGSINNPTNSTNTAEVPMLFIPSSPDINNFYAKCFVHILSDTVPANNEYVEIISFDAVTHMARLATNTVNTWLGGNLNFVIVPDRAASFGNITVADALNLSGGISADRTAIQLASTSSNVSNIYNNTFLRIGQPTSVIGTPPEPYDEQIRVVDYTAMDGLFTAHGGVGTNTFTLNTTSSVNLVGMLLTDSNTNETREIETYNTTTHVGTTTINWGAGAANDVFFIRTVELLTPLTNTITVLDGDSPGTYEIEAINRDNATPFSYNGSLVSSQQSVCYDIDLVNLVLPNSILTNGGRIAFYPFVYVLLENLSSSSGRSDTLFYSNNPNSRRMMFRAVIDDTPTPLVSAFIKIDGDSMIQNVKFKPNDSFRFAVFLPDGSLFQTVAQDTISPNRPNPLVQISALFAFKRAS